MKEAKKRCIVAMALPFLACAFVWAASQKDNTASLFSTLKQQGVKKETIIGIDENGIPMVCGNGLEQAAGPTASGPSPLGLLPAGMRGWECVPNVILNNGIDSFRIEADVNGPVTRVTCSGFESSLVSESGTNFITLRDDGLEGDRIAADNIFTSERLRYNATIPMSPYMDSTNTPAGLDWAFSVSLSIVETNGLTNRFLIQPTVALLNTNVPLVETVMLASNVQASAHLINIVTTNREGQLGLRNGSSLSLSSMSKRVYSVLPDAFDFMSFMTTDHLEVLPQSASANFVAGRHFRARVNYTGTGIGLIDSGAGYGSASRLLGLNVFDEGGRGIGLSTYVGHEYMHQWAFHASAPGLATGDGHYSQSCSADSLLGGFTPIFNGDGTVSRNCSGYGPWEAPPLDKYLMGLIATSAVPPVLVCSNVTVSDCGKVVNVVTQFTIAEFQARNGIRTPGPGSSKTNFTICFVAGSHQRLLTPTEMTFYEIMSAHFTKTLPPAANTPGMNEGLVPITRYFGEGVTWNSEVLGVIRPTITNVTLLTNGMIQVSGTGSPGRNYRLLATTNFVQWGTLTNTIAATNGNFVLHDDGQPQPAARWYKISTP